MIRILSFFIFVSVISFSSSVMSQVFTVTNVNDAGAGSLRQAILDANTYSGTNPQIVFNIPFPATNTEQGWSWWTITLGTTSLPTITKAGTQILGFTQSANRAIVDNSLVGTGGTVGVDNIPLPKFTRPTISINATDKTAPLNINAASVIIEGLSIYNSNENTVFVQGNAANTHIRKMFVGVLPNGNRPTLDADRNTRMGIQIDANAGNLILVSHCYIGHNGRIGINGGSFSSQVIFEFNEVFESNWYGANAHDGIDVNGVNSIVRNNLVYNTRSGNTVPITASLSGAAGIECGTSTAIITNYLIENNTSFGNNGAGINVINGCTRNIIRKNICYNNEVGVSITTRAATDPATAFITMNSIYNNRGVGIDLNHTKTNLFYDGITRNDEPSIGTAPFGNNRQKYPVISAATIQNGMLTITGSLQSVPNTVHRLEFFTNPAKDFFNGVESEFGEGKNFLLAFELTTDSDGFATFNHSSANPTAINLFLSSTASNMVDMVTSEFSPVMPVTSSGIIQPIINLFPAQGFGTLGFEDLWPSKGDYDFNDLVIDYQFEVTSNQNNFVSKIKGTFIIKAFGASFENGFGFQLSNAINANDLSVSGTALTDNYITTNSNGTEAGQAKPTIIVFDNAFKQMPHPGIGIGVNTDPTAPYVQPVTLTVIIDVKPNTYSINDVDISNFNPFLIINKNRGMEVHLPHYPPTSLANSSVLGTLEDASNGASGKYYVTSTNLPWAINIYERFYYPIEKQEILWAHLKFAEWAMSAGIQFPDWYKNLPGYRNNELLYQVPAK